MKKLLVAESQLPDTITDELNIFLSMQYTYGLAEFDVDKIVSLACTAFNLELTDKTFPFLTLSSANSAEVKLQFIQEDYG